jgi:two-component system, OmpR family, sensor kinase
MASLRARLFLILTVLIILTGIGAGGLAFSWALEEAIELQDGILVQIATLADNARFPENALAETVVDSDARFIIQELDDGGAAANNSPQLRDLPDGLHTVSRDDQMWRFLIKTRRDGSRVAIGQSTESRDEIARDSALRITWSLAVLLPCLLLALGIVIRQTLLPMSKLATRLDARRTDNLEYLPLEGVPTELRPFIASISRLLERIRTMVDQQRCFVADASHELRSPIAALSLQAENLLQTELPPQSRARLAALRDGTRRTAHLLDQLLTLARYDMGAFPHVLATSLDNCVKEVVSDLLPRAMDHDIDLGCKAIDSVLVQCEPAALIAMIRNLVDNALRHTPAGGRIDIGLYREDERAILQIEDTGPGIPDADLAQIFEPFFRGRQTVGDGTGLGLSIVKRIVDRFTGSIKLENIAAPGATGLRVTICIPVAGRWVRG